MNRWLCLLFAIALAPLSEMHAAEDGQSKPNIIFLLADDAGFADFGCYGHPYARTRTSTSSQRRVLDLRSSIRQVSHAAPLALD